jgi:hypothetical protein
MDDTARGKAARAIQRAGIKAWFKGEFAPLQGRCCLLAARPVSLWP